MNQSFKTIQPNEITDNVFELIDKEWMLITAGDIENFNTMTASWGGLGILWNKKVCFCVVRPSRYTYEFIEGADTFTLSFFKEKYRKELSFCGTRSGRDVDKIAATGFTPTTGQNKSVFLEEARLVLECKKIYYQDLVPANFLDPTIEKNYNGQDYHRMYVGEILEAYVK